jgi:hypothetical protein
VDKINADGMEKVANMATRILRSIGDNGKDKLVFAKTKDDDQGGDAQDGSDFGNCTDYLYDETGLRIDGVREGKPAANAGCKKAISS